MPSSTADIDAHAVIVGGGIAGLWTLDACRRAGLHAVLLEHRALGRGQTLWSQGIVHGGLKYTLAGLLTDDAREVRDMPGLWRDALAGRAEPDLRAASVRADACHLWRASGLAGRVGMIGARAGLRVGPVRVDPADTPHALRAFRGEVFRVDEQVIDPASVLAALRDRNARRIVRAEVTAIEHAGADAVTVRAAGAPALHAAAVVLTAGLGNAALRTLAGLDAATMQRRPLHMAMARGPLPTLNGHCVAGASTRLTITTARDASGHSVWQIGGQLAEDGVRLTPGDLIARAREELRACLGSFDDAGVRFAAYTADRAEVRTPSGARPPTAFVQADGPVLSAWPTKLALAPRLADRVVELLVARTRAVRIADTDAIDDALAPCPRPDVAAAPWDEPEVAWTP